MMVPTYIEGLRMTETEEIVILCSNYKNRLSQWVPTRDGRLIVEEVLNKCQPIIWHLRLRSKS